MPIGQTQSMTLDSNAVKELALKMGFDEVGITKPASLKEGENAILHYVSENRHGEMKYLEEFENRRKKFYENFPDAKSIIVLGVNYYSNEIASAKILPRNDVALAVIARSKATTQSQFLGRVARYAWGKDYHLVIKKKHDEFIQELKKNTGNNFQAKSCIDAQPIPERFAAQQSGLGFIGKHTGLLSQKFGPWLFLSEIVTNLELKEDEPSTGSCGTCVHCQKICPTGALDDDYKIDAKLCIAYWTIENKGIIPRELRSKIKDWIFGCDECMAICPFTSKQKESNWDELKSDDGFGEWLAIEDLFSVRSNSEYEKKFKGTAMMRINRKQMLRNACIVLGNSHQEQAIPLLEIAFRDSSPLVRLHAAWGLGQFPKTAGILQSGLNQETDQEVKDEIRFAQEIKK